MMNAPTYSFVIPIYNEEQGLLELAQRLGEVMQRMDGSAEAILVDDGSRDRSYELALLLHERDPRFKVVRLSRNFGHQTAITAGMDVASGEAVIIMDADLQDPPKVVLEMAAHWREGYDVVYAVRKARDGETRFKRATAALYYRLSRKLTDVPIPMDAGDFRLVDRKALEAFKSMRESDRYVRGMFGWIGFRQIGVPYTRSARFAGETKYPLRKMLKLAIDGIVGFTNLPLRWALNLGFVVSAVSFLAGVMAIVLKFAGGYVVSGWTSLVVVIFFLGGVQLTVMGMMGEYIGRIYEQVKRRPLYIVSRRHGFADNVPEFAPAIELPASMEIDLHAGQPSRGAP